MWDETTFRQSEGHSHLRNLSPEHLSLLEASPLSSWSWEAQKFRISLYFLSQRFIFVVKTHKGASGRNWILLPVQRLPTLLPVPLAHWKVRLQSRGLFTVFCKTQTKCRKEGLGCRIPKAQKTLWRQLLEIPSGNQPFSNSHKVVLTLREQSNLWLRAVSLSVVLYGAWPSQYLEL